MYAYSVVRLWLPAVMLKNGVVWRGGINWLWLGESTYPRILATETATWPMKPSADVKIVAVTLPKKSMGDAASTFQQSSDFWLCPNFGIPSVSPINVCHGARETSEATPVRRNNLGVVVKHWFNTRVKPRQKQLQPEAVVCPLKNSWLLRCLL